MELLLSAAIGVMVAGAVHLLLRGRPFESMTGLLLLTQAANLVVFASGGLSLDAVPVLDGHGVPHGHHADPLSQALALTSIVISFGTTALVAAVVVAARMEESDDEGHGDGNDDREPPR